MSTLSLRRLADEPDLGMQFVSGVGRSYNAVRLASTTELSHPGRYVMAGELVMTNGLWIASRPPGEWVNEVARAGAVGVAWGLDDRTSEMPPELVVSCLDADLPLLSVQPEVSFALVAARVRTLVLGTAEHALHDQAVRGRQFASITASFDAVLEELLRQTGLTGALMDSDATILASTSKRSFEAQVPALLQMSFSTPLPTPLDETVVFPVLPTGRDRCSLLVVDADLRSVTDEMLLLVGLATMAAAVCDMRVAVAAEHRASETALLIDLLERGALDDVECYGRLRRLGLDLSDTVRVACIAGVPEELRAVRLLLRDAVLHQSGPTAIAILTPAHAEQLERAHRRGSLGDGLRVGWGSGVEARAASIRKSLAEGRLYLDAAGRDASANKLSATVHSLLLAMLDRSVTDTFADGVLGPLAGWDRDNDGQLLVTLTEYFRWDCRVVEASRELFIHPNTLRNRLARIEELTGRSLASNRDRVDFALALEISNSADDSV